MKLDLREVVVGGIYRHFKGNEYQVLMIAYDSETNNNSEPRKVVVYQSINKDKIWVRDYEMFLSVVDKEKYPEVEQKYRFELID